MTNILCVGGVFNDEGGRKSGYFTKLVTVLQTTFKDSVFTIVNGGYWESLNDILPTVKNYDIVLWGADVPNTKPKVVNDLKSINPKMMLVITKNNLTNKYSHKLLTARALKAKANLLIEFGTGDAGYVATILDPLGNTFITREPDIGKVGTALHDRLVFLSTMTRVGSVQVSDIDFPEKVASQDQIKFFELTKRYADQFHNLIHADDNGRMLGNISFRCENGFPTFREGGFILVSRRNIDKRDINSNGMVPVVVDDSNVVKYIGEAKPSVDTPIQRELYRAWPKANYMLHAHVYIEGAPFTENVIPCGALQEVDEILKVLPVYNGGEVAYVNLRGHGSVAIAENVETLEKIPYIARPVH